MFAPFFFPHSSFAQQDTIHTPAQKNIDSLRNDYLYKDDTATRLLNNRFTPTYHAHSHIYTSSANTGLILYILTIEIFF